MPTLDNALGDIQACDNLDRLHGVFLSLCRRLGFASFSYVDVRGLRSGEVLPFFQTSVRTDFARTYQDEGFILHDPVFNRAATTNAPFRWSDLPEFSLTSSVGRASRQRQVLESAYDHGYTEGYVLPVHALDAAGRPASSLLSLYWTQRPAEMGLSVPSWLRLVALAYHEKALALRGVREGVTPPPPLTGRERDCLLWACRGKTIAETAIILTISDRTVKFHMENAMQKLGVHNKFHAIAMAIQLGIIAP
ncbi:LuxR family transcriptional regulator [Niveispirillum sp.]|uniref:helix-turn-helix transcriptional regulator n=1 Tax=Niveispirillum sp. TaxID=1917217 RepID=UPI001B77D5DF|nr:LuxR family transcriptional regulator [Niveispirillum sp.]MBP7336776.1 LuxR family transcriptional regulator [Niveispirillum sp.]